MKQKAPKNGYLTALRFCTIKSLLNLSSFLDNSALEFLISFSINQTCPSFTSVLKRILLAALPKSVRVHFGYGEEVCTAMI